LVLEWFSVPLLALPHFGRENTGWLAWQKVNVAPPKEAQPAEPITIDIYV
jgi:hypothetical protein